MARWTPLYAHIIDYLGEVSESRLSDRNADEIAALLNATNDLEAIGDLISTNITQHRLVTHRAEPRRQ